MSKLEVDAIEPQSGTTLTIGASGDSVNIASGATITDFTSTGIDDNATSTAITINSSEQVEFTDGTGSLPSITNTGDTDTGILFSGSNEMSFTTGGSIGMIFNSVGTLNLQRATSVNYNFNGYAGGVGTGNQIRFGNDNGTVGSIITSGSSTAYNTSSDYRLKENISYDFDATTRLKQLKPARFNFIRDANKTVDGFLAHEVQDIIPEAITGTKDATVTKEKVVVNVYDNVIAENIEQADWEAGKIVDENGNTRYPTDSTWVASKVVPVYQGIDQSKLTPILTKALQEAIAKIEQLEARLTALENN
jgi:hypothetical protein